MSKKIKWGIIGLGKIAHIFAHDLALVEQAELFGAASRDGIKAKEFAQRYNTQKSYASYEALAADPEIDVIYIATPHVFHFEHTLLCFENNKSVLCEKPMGMNGIQTQKMIEMSKSKGLFLMEGLWTRFIPATEKLIDLLERKTIGDIIFMRADFGFKAARDLDGRIYNKELGGGSLLDVGIYPIYLSLLTLGSPNEISAAARFTPSGVDGYCSMMFHYDHQSKASLESSIEANTPTEAHIYGTNGSITLHSKFHHSEKLTLRIHGQPEEVVEVKYAGNGYVHEIIEVHRCLRSGLIESEKHSHQRSLDLSEMLERVSDQIGLNYDNA